MVCSIYSLYVKTPLLPHKGVVGGLLLFAILIFFTGSATAAEPVHITAQEVLYDDLAQEVRARGNVAVTWEDVFVTTEEIVFFLKTSLLLVPSAVTFRVGEHEVRGEALSYQFETGEGWFEQSRLTYRIDEVGRLLFRGERIEVDDETWRGEDLLLTGCATDPPLYSVRARNVTIYPGERVMLEGLGLYYRGRRLIEIPAWSRALGRGASHFFPQLGFQIERGYFLELNYDYLFTPDLLFQAALSYSTRQRTRFSLDLVATLSEFEGRMYYDYWQQQEPGYGGYITYAKDDLELWLIAAENERWKGETLSRVPQFTASYRADLGNGAYIEGTGSIGAFVYGDIRVWREEGLLTAGWENDALGGKAFLHSALFDGEDGFFAVGGKLWAEHDFSSSFSAGISYTVKMVEGYSPFFFDPADTHALGLDFTLGDPDASYLRLRGDYDLDRGEISTITAGLGIGSREFSVGVEGVYAFDIADWEERRYFVRHMIEECVSVEASWWEMDRTFFLSVNLVGIDPASPIQSLFDDPEEYDPYRVER